MTPEPIVEVGADGEALPWRATRLIAARVRCVRTFWPLLFRRLDPEAGSEPGVCPHFFGGTDGLRRHQHSSSRMAREALIDHAPVPAAQVHPIPTNSASPERAATLYEATLQSSYGSKTLDPERPLFEVTSLGLGEDSHTASLFPEPKALDKRDAW